MTTSSSLHANSKLRSSLSFERRPKLLKDFLIDDVHSCSSSNGFRSYPRKTSKSVVQKVPEIILKRTKSNKTSSQLFRSRSRAASNTIFAIHKASEMVTNALKYLPFASIKSPSILPRSISRKLSGRRKEKYDYVEGEVSVTVKVKDILRWRSFRDLVEDRSTPLDLPCSPNRCTTTTTTTDSTSTLTSCSQSSSWCDSDFTVEDFPSWCYENDECFDENEVKMAKQYLLDEGVGEGFMETTRSMDMDPKRDLPIDDEYEQHTPVSVLDSPFREDEESSLIFHRSLANIDRRKCVLMQRINEFESLADLETINLEHRFSTEKSTRCFDGQEEDEDVNEAEEKAKQLLGHLKDKSCLANNCDPNLENYLLFDFFRHELSTSRKQKNDKYESELLRLADNWLNGVYEGSFEWEVEGKRESYVREMERGLSWNKLEEEQEEMALQLESLMISSLLDELLTDLLVNV